jgi:hypothetical protein
VSSVQGPEPTRAGQSASSRSLFHVLVIAAMLLLAALAAAPAYGQDAGGTTSPPTSDPSPPPPPASDPSPPPPPVAAPDQPADNTPPADSSPPPADPPPPTDPGAGDSTPTASDPTAGDAGHKQPAHPNDEFTTSTSSPAPSTTSPSSSTAGPSKDLAPLGTGHSDTWLGQDTFVIDKATTRDHDGLTTVRRRFAGLFLFGASTKATRTEAKARRAHETAKVSALGSGGPPPPGSPLPNQNPFFNLLSGPGGIAASLMLASVLAVLGAAFVLPRDRLKAFRTPTVTWRPLAYVPPIELPG